MGQSFFDGDGQHIILGEATKVDDDWNEWSPRVGVQYQWRDNLMT